LAFTKLPSKNLQSFSLMAASRFVRNAAEVSAGMANEGYFKSPAMARALRDATVLKSVAQTTKAIRRI
jgi:hypothetical protein